MLFATLLRQESRVLFRSARCFHKSSMAQGRASSEKDKAVNPAMEMANNHNYTTYQDIRKNGLAWLLNHEGQTSYRTISGERARTEVGWTVLMSIIYAYIFWVFYHKGSHFLMHPYLDHEATHVSDEDLGLDLD